MTNLKYFITGTDTEVGKTYITCELLKAFNCLQLSTLGLKPIASGILENEQYTDDTKQLWEASSFKIHPKEITPFAFKKAIAPHIACEKTGGKLSVALINTVYRDTLNLPVDVCLIEGFGGWFAPLNATETMADFVIAHNFKVILVVGMRLGCINHAILTERAIAQSGLKIAGWIANSIDAEMAYRKENIASLKKLLSVPYLGFVPYGAAFGDDGEFGVGTDAESGAKAEFDINAGFGIDVKQLL